LGHIFSAATLFLSDSMFGHFLGSWAGNLPSPGPEDLVWEKTQTQDAITSEEDFAACASSERKRRDRGSTIIIFDWDDTLLCSSLIHSSRPPTKTGLKDLEDAAKTALAAAMLLGETLVVTNGNRTWVEDSARRYLPGLMPILAKLTVVSARSLYEGKYPSDPFMWKRASFQHLLQDVRQFPQRGNLNLVVLGDQNPEIDAAHHMAEVLGGDSVLVKTVKFVDTPTLSELIGQLSKFESGVSEIVGCEESWSRHLMRKEESLDGPKEQVRLASAWRLSARSSSSEMCVVGFKEIWRLFF